MLMHIQLEVCTPDWSTLLSSFPCIDPIMSQHLFFNVFSYFPFLTQNHGQSSTDYLFSLLSSPDGIISTNFKWIKDNVE